MTTGEVRHRLASKILELSRAYAGPVFAPHITLASGIVGLRQEVASKMADLARRITPFTVRLTEVDCVDEYFRCLFVRVEPTHSIRKANTVAREVFCLQKQAAFMPHLSLLYGSFPSSMKEGIVASLDQQFGLEIKARTLHLYLIKGKPQAWRCMGRFGLRL
jgi:2'-5' RNA ligase